jgi:two-component system, sensor histidine kinase LadS
MKYQFYFIALFMAQILRGSPTPALPWHAQVTNLSGYLTILNDAKGDITIKDILKDTTANKWQTYPSDYLQLGYTKNYIWLRLDIDFQELPTEKLYWWYDMSPPQDVQFYHIEKDSIVKYFHTGINFPYVQRDVQNRMFIFSFQPKTKGKTTILARIHSDVGSLVGYAYLNTQTDFAIIDHKNLGWWLGWFSFMFFAAFLSLGLWGAFREKIYAYYGAYLICAAMLMISVNGFGYEWFWGNSPILANSTKVVWTYGLVGFLLVFVYRLLYEALKNYGWLKKSIQILTGILVLTTLLALNYTNFSLASLPTLLILGNTTILANLFFIFFMLIVGIYKRYQPAYYFLCAFLPVVCTGIVMMLRNAGYIHSPYIQSSFIAMPAFIIEIFLLFLALMKRFQTLQKNQREKMQMELESQMRLQSERERISRDLHDNVGAQLSYIISNIDNIIETHNNDNNRLTDVADTAKNAILNLRETIWAINNEHITVEDFYDRFKLYAHNQVKNRTDIQVVFRENIGHNHLLNPNLALNLYRICQEALNNALKYAQAHTIDIFIQTNDTPYFQCHIKDDGIGFDLSENIENMEERQPDGTSRDSRETIGTGGYGLKNMKARAQEMGADFRLISEKGKGTLVEIFLKNQSKKASY